MKAEAKRSKEAQPNVPVPMGQRVQREVIAWFWVALVFLLINGTIGQARVIPSGSMEDTLLIGDHLIMSKPPFAPDTPDYVKRVIGLPGDSVEIHDGSVWVNGQRLKENYTTGRTEPYDLRQPFTVPPNCYFVMGDNRGNSYDSRFWGCVPRNDIIGTPVMIYMSLDVPPDAWEPGQIRERFFAYANALVHPSLVRWKRLFRTF